MSLGWFLSFKFYYVSSGVCVKPRTITYIREKKYIDLAKVAYLGVWPSVAHDGKPLDVSRQKKSNKRMVGAWAVVEFRGDWKWHKEQFGLSRFYNWKAPGLCHMCETTNRPGNLRYLVFIMLTFLCWSVRCFCVTKKNMWLRMFFYLFQNRRS